MSDTDASIVTLELKFAELENTVQDLNSVVVDQWKRIDKLEQQNKFLKDRLLRVEYKLPEDDDKPPPHY